MPITEKVTTFDGLAAIVARLRAPGGCPWDREQTHGSLKPYLLEETYEALEALDRGDLRVLQEELGDLLLNILMHCQIASEAGEFEVRDVIHGIGEKLIRRHPHVFGDLQVSSAQEVMDNWEVLKTKERAEKASMLEGLPSSLPALAYTRSLQERLAPLQLPLQDSPAPGPLRMPQESATPAPAFALEELGRRLFALAAEAAAAGQDPEEALRLANSAFRQRVQRLEELAWKQGTSLQALSPALRADLWTQAT